MARPKSSGPTDQHALFFKAVTLGHHAGVHIPFPSDLPTRNQKPLDLFDTYIKDIRVIEEDMARRPSHYTTDDRDVLEQIRKGTAKTKDKSELLLKYTERTKPVPPATRKDPSPASTSSTFEDQDFDGIILI